MASAEAKLRLGKKTFGIVLSKNDSRMPRFGDIRVNTKRVAKFQMTL